MSEVPVTSEEAVASEPPVARDGVSRRTLLRVGAVGGAAVALVGVEGVGRPFLAERGLLSADGAFAATSIALADQLYIEAFPTSPLILAPFTDELFIPTALRPVQPSDLSPGPRPGVGPTELAGERDAPDLAEPDRLPGSRSSTRSTMWSRPTPSPPRRCMPIDQKGRPTFSFDASGQKVPAGRADVAAEHDLRLQRHLSRPDDQRRVRQTGAGAVRRTSSTRTRSTSTARTSGRRTGRPDPPAQRPHRTGERRQPALLDDAPARSTRASGPGSGSTACT